MRERMRVPWPAARTMAAGAVRMVDTCRDGRGARFGASTALDGCNRLDLDPRALGQVAHGEGAPRRERLRDLARVDLVDRRPVGDVGEVDGYLHEAIHTAVRGVEDGPQVGQRARRLHLHLVAGQLAAGRVDPKLAGCEDELAGPDRLAVWPCGGRCRIGSDRLSHRGHASSSSMASMAAGAVRVRVTVVPAPARS